jgi:hypothetical protein
MLRWKSYVSVEVKCGCRASCRGERQSYKSEEVSGDPMSKLATSTVPAAMWAVRLMSLAKGHCRRQRNLAGLPKLQLYQAIILFCTCTLSACGAL